MCRALAFMFTSLLPYIININGSFAFNFNRNGVRLWNQVIFPWVKQDSYVLMTNEAPLFYCPYFCHDSMLFSNIQLSCHCLCIKGLTMNAFLTTFSHRLFLYRPLSPPVNLSYSFPAALRITVWKSCTSCLDFYSLNSPVSCFNIFMK